MFFDMNTNGIVDELMVYPDFAFGDLPRAEPLIEIDFVQGNNITSINVTGSNQ